MNGPYAYKGNQWVGYDTKNSAETKANYILSENLGGAMFWETSTDDFNVRLSLLNSYHKGRSCNCKS